MSYSVIQFQEPWAACSLGVRSLTFEKMLVGSALLPEDFILLNEKRKIFRKEPWKDPERNKHLSEMGELHQFYNKNGVKMTKSDNDYLLHYRLDGKQMLCSMVGLYNVAFRMFWENPRGGIQQFRDLLTADLREENLLLYPKVGNILRVLTAIGAALGYGALTKLYFPVVGQCDMHEEFYFGVTLTGREFGRNCHAPAMASYMLNLGCHPDQGMVGPSKTSDNDFAHVSLVSVKNRTDQNFKSCFAFRRKSKTCLYVTHEKKEVEHIKIQTVQKAQPDAQIQTQLKEQIDLQNKKQMALITDSKFVDTLCLYGRYRTYQLYLDEEDTYSLPEKYYRKSVSGRGNSKRKTQPGVNLCGCIKNIYPVLLDSRFNVVSDTKIEMYYKHSFFTNVREIKISFILTARVIEWCREDYPPSRYHSDVLFRDSTAPYKLNFYVFSKEKLEAVYESNEHIFDFRAMTGTGLQRFENPIVSRLAKRRREYDVVSDKNKKRCTDIG